MKKKIWAVLGVVLAAFLAFYFLVPQRAVRENMELYNVERNGVGIMEKLSQEQLDALEALALHAECARWRNPKGAYPLREDTIALGLLGEGAPPYYLYLAGSVDRYWVSRTDGKDYDLREGGALLAEALHIIGDIR